MNRIGEMSLLHKSCSAQAVKWESADPSSVGEIRDEDEQDTHTKTPLHSSLADTQRLHSCCLRRLESQNSFFCIRFFKKKKKAVIFMKEETPVVGFLIEM